MLKTKSILSMKEASDGLRISIMSRHTLNDGVTPNPKITSESYDQWMKLFAPRDKLVGDYYKRGLSWEQFEKGYLQYIRCDVVRPEVEKLAERCLDSVITLLCIEESAQFCHRRLLAEECKRYQPKLDICVY